MLLLMTTYYLNGIYESMQVHQLYLVDLKTAVC